MKYIELSRYHTGKKDARLLKKKNLIQTRLQLYIML